MQWIEKYGYNFPWSEEGHLVMVLDSESPYNNSVGRITKKTQFSNDTYWKVCVTFDNGETEYFFTDDLQFLNVTKESVKELIGYEAIYGGYGLSVDKQSEDHIKGSLIDLSQNKMLYSTPIYKESELFLVKNLLEEEAKNYHNAISTYYDKYIKNQPT